MRLGTRSLSLLVLLAFGASRSEGAIITATFTRTSSQGTHDDWGTAVTPRAVISNAFGEDHRGITEYNIAGLTPTGNAVINFSLFAEGGLPFNINLVAYHGDGVYNQSTDWSIAPFATVAAFSNAGPTPGTLFSFDITAALNAALANGDTFIGFRLQRTDNPAGTNFPGNFADFRDFTLDVAQEGAAIPEPATMAVFGLMAVGGGLYARRRTKAVAA